MSAPLFPVSLISRAVMENAGRKLLSVQPVLCLLALLLLPPAAARELAERDDSGRGEGLQGLGQVFDL